MRPLLLIAVLCFTAHAQAFSSLNCVQNADKSWQPANAIIKIGLYGWLNQDTCQEAITSAGLYSVCVWNGYNYQPHSTETGQPIGVKYDGYDFFTDCLKTTESDVGGVVCNFNDRGYAPYYSASGHPAGAGNNSLENLHDCEQLTSQAKNATICNWDGKHYSAYNKASNKLVKSFESIDDCTNFTKTPGPGNPAAYQWNQDTKNKITSCTQTDISYPHAQPATLPLPTCLKRGPVTFTVTSDDKCTATTPDGKNIDNTPLDACMQNREVYRLKNGCVYGDEQKTPVQDLAVCAKAVDIYDPQTQTVQLGGQVKWTGRRGDQCGEFITDSKGTLKFVHNVDASNCMIPSLTFFQWLDASSKTCVGYSACGVSVGVINSAQCAGKVNHFAQSWPEQGFTWADCAAKSESGTTIPFDPKGNFMPECAPDVLYGWHSTKRVMRAMENHDAAAVISLKGNHFFLWRTPIGSFGYGDGAMRMKLKPNLKFVLIAYKNKDCDALRKTYDADQTVFVDRNSTEANGYYSEYLLCSNKPIESWSSEMPYDINEMNKEYDWIRAHEHDQEIYFDSMSGSNTANALPWSVTRDWDSDPGRKTDWSEAALKSNIQRASGNTNLGQAFFDRNTVPSLWNHFSTSQPGYFNGFNGTNLKETWPEREADACTRPQ